MKNGFIKEHIMTMEQSLDVFMSGCSMAAEQDDGKLDAEEKKIIKKLQNATEKYRKELEKIKNM